MTASITDNLQHVHSVLTDAVIDDREAGIYRANRRIFTDEDIFELEMKHIFEGNWIYLAHESQVPNPGDYFTTYIGRQPVMITRDKNGELHCLINACAHRSLASALGAGAKGGVVRERRLHRNAENRSAEWHG